MATLNRMTPEQRQRLCAILEALSKHKSELQTDLGTVWQECGSAEPHVFFFDWEVVVDKGFVVGSVTNDNDKIITGTGRITPRGEEALKNPALWEEGNR
ncbi:MAG TPA: hypothetical protein VN939_21465 [Chthoniobacterales bacterium]|nr:hypothetical protein [Chthoniobacterales bacterium]